MLSAGTILSAGTSFALAADGIDTDSLLHTNGSVGVVGVLLVGIVFGFYAVGKKWIVPGWAYAEKCSALDDAMKELDAHNENDEALKSLLTTMTNEMAEIKRSVHSRPSQRQRGD